MSRKIEDGMTNAQRHMIGKKTVAVRLTDTEYEQLQRLSDKHGITVTEWVREAIAFYKQWQNENA